MKRRACRLCFGTLSRFEILESPRPDGPYFILTLCPCARDLPVHGQQLEHETEGSPAVIP